MQYANFTKIHCKKQNKFLKVTKKAQHTKEKSLLVTGNICPGDMNYFPS